MSERAVGGSQRIASLYSFFLFPLSIGRVGPFRCSSSGTAYSLSDPFSTATATISPIVNLVCGKTWRPLKQVFEQLGILESAVVLNLVTVAGGKILSRQLFSCLDKGFRKNP